MIMIKFVQQKLTLMYRKLNLMYRKLTLMYRKLTLQQSLSHVVLDPIYHCCIGFL